MLSVERVDAGYGDVQTLWGVSLAVHPGEVVALVGANAAGKTTTIRTISGTLRPHAGRIVMEGQDLARKSPDEIVEAGIVQVPEGRRLFTTMSVVENLQLGGYNKRARPHVKQNLKRVFDLLPELAGRQQQQAGSLSGGQQQMVAIGRGLMAMPKILILDEMSLGLSPLLVKRMFQLVKAVAAEGTTIIIVEQNVRQALAVANRAYVLENGRVVLEGAADELAEDDHLRKAYLGM